MYKVEYTYMISLWVYGPTSVKKTADERRSNMSDRWSSTYLMEVMKMPLLRAYITKHFRIPSKSSHDILYLKCYESVSYPARINSSVISQLLFVSFFGVVLYKYCFIYCHSGTCMNPNKAKINLIGVNDYSWHVIILNIYSYMGYVSNLLATPAIK